MGPLLPPWLLEHPAEITAAQWLTTRISGFVLLVALIWKFLVPVLREKLAARTREVQETRDHVAETIRELEAMRDDYKRRLDSIAEETDRRLKAAVTEAQVLKEQIVEEARQLAQEIVRHAQEEVERDREKALARLRIEFSEDVIEAARHAASLTLTPSRQAALVAAFLNELEARP